MDKECGVYIKWTITQPEQKRKSCHVQQHDDVMLSEISLSQKDRYCVIPLIRSIQNSQTPRSREKNAGCQRLGGGETESCCSTSIK